MTEAPNAEDWETLTLYRASHTKLIPIDNLEETKRASEVKLRQATAIKQYAAMEAVQQKEIESRFAAYLQTSNSFACAAYHKTGLCSSVVVGAFHEWLVCELL
jgi:chaperone required for assembly of F1-ATPase